MEANLSGNKTKEEETHFMKRGMLTAEGLSMAICCKSPCHPTCPSVHMDIIPPEEAGHSPCSGPQEPRKGGEEMDMIFLHHFELHGYQGLFAYENADCKEGTSAASAWLC